MRDIISEVGGIGGSLGMIIAAVSALFILYYIINLTKMIQRKNMHQVRKAYIKKKQNQAHQNLQLKNTRPKKLTTRKMGQ